MAPALSIIGCGNMGTAILRGALEAGVLRPADLLVAEVDPDRRSVLAEFGCAVTADAADAAGSSNLLLAVKPQTFPEIAATLAPLRDDAVVISIMAGLSSETIRDALGERARVIRVMPNTPSQIGRGVSAIAAGAGARAGDETLARKLFGAIGGVVDVTEDQMYAVTAISGGGPAYVCLLAETMERAAIELGIDPEAARPLVIGTIAGAGALMEQSDRDPAALREAVTSKGGTTAEALKVLGARDLPDIVLQAMTAARDRGIELDRV